MVKLQVLYDKACDALDSAFEAGQLLEHVTGHNPAKAPVAAGEASEEQQIEFDDLLQKRQGGFPLQYLLGEWEFYSLPFKLGPGVLIPRQDTETLVDEAIKLAGAMDSPDILDICSGSGCIAVSLKRNLPDASVTAVEFSEKAFPYLEQNIALNGVDVHAVLSDLREYTHPRPLDMVVSNPPYIPRKQLAALQPEISHEPLIALDGGEDGLRYFRAIARRYREQLRDGGLLLLEVGAGQADDVAGILADNRFADIRRVQDLNGIDRVIIARCAK